MHFDMAYVPHVASIPFNGYGAKSVSKISGNRKKYMLEFIRPRHFIIKRQRKCIAIWKVQRARIQTHTHTETDYMWLCMFVWTLRNRSLCWVDTLLLVVVVVVVNVGPIAYVLALQFNKFHFACPENCYTPYTHYFTLYHTQNSPATHTHIHNQTTTLRMLMLELQFRCASSVPCRKPVNKHC